MSFYSDQKERDYKRKQMKIRREGEAAMAAHNKGLRLNEAKKQVSGGSSSSGMADKISAASSALSALKGDGSSEAGGSTDAVGGALSGASQGAAMGSAFGAPGAIIGGGLGAVTGIMGAKAARKKQAAEAQAQHRERMVGIEQEKTRRLQSAFQSLSSAFSQSLL